MIVIFKMRYLLFILFSLCSLGLYAQAPSRHSINPYPAIKEIYHEILLDYSTGAEIVLVNNNGQRYYLNVLMFDRLYNQGGYESVNRFYLANQQTIDRTYKFYGNYHVISRYVGKEKVRNFTPATRSPYQLSNNEK